ncbi:zinc dependent phospholipase C family protein [Paenibacillus sp. SYP-B3998]|uniref:Zinc dependent phospholipase C family protein n=1 Tax=Paenibacillus sp. SYP-B3998 TaxID=2678564 RepID=A0A6G3ZWR3_9BACL|nr:zinc dependent phospholipase C family protein [Paenibacillus sp. SYP-B3998]NEW06572.1 zinc dependent phospholipase C family protein [Paenibacillus sp. SYP-B3998]
MPNVWTHLLFGQELMTQINHGHALNDKQLRRVFSLGCQGPDFLFYHNFLPWQKDTTMNQLGSLMHTEACGTFLLDLLKQVQGRGLYNPAVLYVLGFITHHVLDRNMHPYVFYKSGFKKWDHQRFEIIMDTLIVQRKLGLPTWKTPVWKEIDVGDALPLGVARALTHAAAAHYSDLALQLTEDDWNTAYRDMLRAQRLFHDPKGIKRVLTFGQISPFVYKKKPAPLDYMNEARTVWNCPTSLDETYTYSVWDLWDLAMEDGKNVLLAAVKALQSGLAADFEVFQSNLGNRSYETGKPCDSGLEILYTQPIL